MSRVVSISTFRIEPRWRRFYFSLRIAEGSSGLLCTVSGWNQQWNFASPSSPFSAGKLSLKGKQGVFFSTEVDYDLGLIADEAPYRAASFPRIPNTPLLHRKRPQPIAIQIADGKIEGLYEDQLNLAASNPQAYFLNLYFFTEEKGGKNG